MIIKIINLFFFVRQILKVQQVDKSFVSQKWRPNNETNKTKTKNR